MSIKSGNSYLDKLDNILHRNKLLWLFFTIQFAVIIILIIGYINLKGSVVVHIEIPPKIYDSGQLRIGSKKADKLYFRMWGRYIVENMSSYNADTIENKYSETLYMLHPSIITKYKHKFTEKIDIVKSNLIKNDFFLVDSNTYVSEEFSSATFKANGVSKLNVGDGLATEYQSCTYEISMKLEGYHLFVNDLQENCKTISEIQFDTKKKGDKK
ncbi:MAG: TraE-like protein [uncultured Campylobacterales bacterium]|uniref:TraE-like protein n=1 Tax=uncultured Campylobacterales bacterium TaxID=352960 RepID=A0A6S6SN27_9BACT|nr:MAG: TraE-like protein [uncultured Campylobacterales bacterium]